ncbi:MAG: hypothetical protein WC916_00045 [Candidatus Woesearchaeota archaeon]
MPVPSTLPLLSKPETTKDRVFIILSGKYPLSLIELQHAIKNQFNNSVSFQSVRKAVLQLVEEGVLIKEGKKFSFSKDWIIGLIKYGNLLQRNYFSQKKEQSKLAIGEEVTVYTLNSLVDLDYIWNGLIVKALQEKETPKIITFRAEHFWFIIATLAQETGLIKEMIKKNIQLYYISYGNTPLDQWTIDMYKQIGIHCMRLPKPKNYPAGLHVGTYGDYIIHSQHPQKITKKIEKFFQKYQHTRDISLVNIGEIVNAKEEIQLQVIHNPLLAESTRNEIVHLFDKKLFK